MKGYWSSVLNRRLTRRRALAVTGGLAAAAALSACSSDSDKPAVDSSALANKADESAGAVPGGIYPTVGATTGGSIDPHFNSNTGGFGESFKLYGTPVKWGRSIGKMPSPSTITGDVFESWEIVPGGQQINLRLRPGLTFDNRPPTNGRVVTIEDVKFSWDRSAALSPVMSEVLHSKGDAGPLESLSVVDNRTVSIKMAFPYGAILELLAFWYFFIMPREAEGGFNPRVEARGTGPFQLTKWDGVNTTMEYRRNPDYYVKGRPYLDGHIKYSVPEYAAALSQFESGAIWTNGTGFSTTIKQDEVLRVKKDHPKMVMRQSATPPWALPHAIPFIFSQREDSPFRDVRLRHAASMLFDSEAFVEVWWNVKQFKDAGFDFEVRRDGHLSNNCFNWIDPRDKDFGPNAKYYEYNVTEAKRLIAASGYNGTFDFNYRNSAGGTFAGPAEVYAGMLEAGGFKMNRKPLDPNTTWAQYKETGFEGYSGIYQNSVQAFNDDFFLVTQFTPSGRNHVSSKPLPEISDRVQKIQFELDLEKRNGMIKQFAKDVGAQMPTRVLDYDQKPYLLHWPWLKNFNVFSTLGFDVESNTSGRPIEEFWYDATQRT